MKTKLSIILILSSIAMISIAEEFTVGQKNKAFTQKEIKIKVGDSINFINKDPFFHNVYSLADVQTFDLGSYATGMSKTVIFDTKGILTVECAIHPSMVLNVIVE